MSIKLEDLLTNYFAEKTFQAASARTPHCLPFWVLADAPIRGLHGLDTAQIEHARSCPACQRSLVLSLRSLCPSDEQLQLYCEGRSTIADAITAHLDTEQCPQCTKVVAPAATVSVSPVSTPTAEVGHDRLHWLRSLFGTWRFVLTAACLLAAFFLGALSFAPSRHAIFRLARSIRPSKNPSPSTLGPLVQDPYVAAHYSPSGQVLVDAPSVPPSLRDQVQRLLEVKPVDQDSAVVAALHYTQSAIQEEQRNKRPNPSRGATGSAAEAPIPVSPSAVLVATVHPSLHWNPVTAAQGYRITLVDTAGGPNLNFPSRDGSRYFPLSDGTSFTLPPDTPLQPGHTYQWEFVAKTPGTPIYSRPAFFAVLDPKSLQAVQQIENQFSASPLLLVALYQSYGCYDDAAAQLDKVKSLDRRLKGAMRAALTAQRSATGVQH